MEDNVRTRQRFANFKKALKQLEKAVAQGEYSDLELAGLVQTFKFTFELGWKTIKDYLKAGGSDVATPREVIKIAFAEGLITDGEVWLDALDKRNIVAHIYDNATSKEIVHLIRIAYLPVLQHFYDSFATRLT